MTTATQDFNKVRKDKNMKMIVNMTQAELEKLWDRAPLINTNTGLQSRMIVTAAIPRRGK